MIDTLRAESLREHFSVIPARFPGRKKTLDAVYMALGLVA